MGWTKVEDGVLDYGSENVVMVHGVQIAKFHAWAVFERYRDGSRFMRTRMNGDMDIETTATIYVDPAQNTHADGTGCCDADERETKRRSK
jgi:hypothetical protein